MEIITSQDDYDKAKYNTQIILKCKKCSKEFNQWKKYVKSALKLNEPINYCSRKCQWEAQKNGKTYDCRRCGKSVYRTPADMVLKKNKHGKPFCSQSCSAIYHNLHKTTGFNRSKLEKWLETKLYEIYPNLFILYNERKTIKGELDIYIPSLKLAFELNGPFHYENIFGTLDKIQNNDKRKFQACIERGISLCVIDTSKQRYFKERTSIQFLDIVIKIINEKLLEGLTQV